MRTLLRLIINIFNYLHTQLADLFKLSAYEFTDKQLHFIILGLFFLVLFIFVEAIFKRLAKLSVSIISFIYVFTVGTVVALAIEVGQYQSGSGQMDFKDVTWGLYGLVIFIVVYALIRAMVVWVYHVLRNK